MVGLHGRSRDELPNMLPGAWAGADVGGVGRCPARSELMATRRATRIGDETLLTRAGGVPRVGMGGAGCRDRGLGGLVAGWDARVLTASGSLLSQGDGG